MSFTKVAPAGIGTSPGTSIRIGDSLLHSTGIDIGSNTGVGVTIRQHGDATFTGIVTAASFSGSGANLTGIDATSIKHTDGNVKVQAINTGANLTGNLAVSGNATVTGTLGVGGVVTYEDVTNVDSVGVVTARSGIKIGPTAGVAATIFADGSINSTGIVTATTFVGALTGNVTGNVSGSSGSATGNAGGLTGTPNISCGTIAGSTGTFTGDVDIADKIIHTGDTNTAIRFPAADTVTVETGGTERLRINSTGQTIVGDSVTQLTTSSERPFQVHSINGPKIAIGRNDTSISDGNTIGGIEFYGNDANGTFVNTASIIVDADGAHGDNDKPTRMLFYTTADGGSSATERLRIDSAGNMSLGKGSASSTGYGRNFQIHHDGTSGASLHLTDNNTGSGNGDGFHIISTSQIAYLWQRENANMVFGTNGSARWDIYGSNGHLAPNADSTYDIGTSSVRVRNGYFDTVYGDGSNLTGISGVSVANQSDNRLVTATGTTDALNAESGLTYNGTALSVSGYVLSEGTSNRGGVFGKLHVGYDNMYLTVQPVSGNNVLHLNYSNGNEVHIGDQNGSTLTVNGAIQPKTDSAHDLGLTGTRFRAAYADKINATHYQCTATISSNYTVTTTYNEMMIGPITINNGVTLAVNTGARLVVL